MEGVNKYCEWSGQSINLEKFGLCDSQVKGHMLNS